MVQKAEKELESGDKSYEDEEDDDESEDMRDFNFETEPTTFNGA